MGLGLASLIILHVLKILLVGSDQSPKCGYEMYNNAKNSIETLLSGCCGDVADEFTINDHSVTTPRKHDDATLEVLPLDTDDDKTSVCSPHMAGKLVFVLNQLYYRWRYIIMVTSHHQYLQNSC